MRRLKLKLCSVLLVLLMGLSSLQGYAMYDPNALHGGLVSGTERITNLTQEVPTNLENGEASILLRGIVTFNELEGGFYEVGGYRLMGEYDFQIYLGEMVEVAGVRDLNPSIFMTKAVKVLYIDKVIATDFVDEQGAIGIDIPREELISEQLILMGLVKYKDISGGYYELDGFRLTGEYDFSKYLGEVVEVSGIEDVNEGADIFMTRAFKVSFLEVADKGLYEKELVNTIQALLTRFEALGTHRNQLVERSNDVQNDLLVIENQYFATKKQLKEKLEELIGLEGRDLNLDHYRALGRVIEVEEGDVTIYKNGCKVNFTAPPIIDSGSVMVPIRALAEEMDCTITWQAESRKAIVEKEGIKIEIVIDQNTALVNGQALSLDRKAVIKNNRILIPLRFFVENMQAQIEWFSIGNLVAICSE